MVKKLQVLVLGDRDQPLAPAINLTALSVGELGDLLARIREKTPDATYETVVRAVVRAGQKSIIHTLRSGYRVEVDGSVITLAPAPAAKKKAKR